MNNEGFDIVFTLPERTNEQIEDLAKLQELFNHITDIIEKEFDRGLKNSLIMSKGVKVDFKNGRVVSFSGVINKIP